MPRPVKTPHGRLSETTTPTRQTAWRKTHSRQTPAIQAVSRRKPEDFESSENQRGRQDQNLSERGDAQCARHAIWPQARHGRADDPHNGHPEIHRSSRSHIGHLNEVPPDEKKSRRKRNPDGGSVGGCVPVSGYHLVCKTNAENESAKHNKRARRPVPSID